MHVITEEEKQQLLEGASRMRELTTASADPRVSLPPTLSIVDYLDQVEQLNRLIPPVPRQPAQGEHWKL